MTHRRIILLLFIALDNILVLWFSGFVLFNFKINEYSEETYQKNDSIIILTGGRHRIEQGIELLNNDKAEKLFVSGVSAKTTLDDLLKEANVRTSHKNKIELGYTATNTVENALEIKNWITENNIKSVYLVTSNYHIPRSLEELSALNMDLNITPYPVYSEKISAEWWQSWKTFSFLAKEYNKYLYVCVRNLILGAIK